MTMNRKTTKFAACHWLALRCPTRARRTDLCGALAIAIIACLVLAQPLFSAETPPQLPASESIGGALLDDLDLDMLKRKAPKETPAAPAAGEDLGERPSSPLQHIEQGMRTAQKMLSTKSQPQQTVRVQQQVIDDLDKLIDQLAQQQCQNCQQSPSASQSQSQQQAKQSGQQQQESQTSQQATSSQTAAEDSSARLEEGTGAADQLESVPAIYKELWGHLPETVRQQLLQAPSDQFLPKYEKLLQKYFRRLAEEGDKDSIGRRPTSP